MDDLDLNVGGLDVRGLDVDNNIDDNDNDL
jgi:hypothetical protein